MSETQSNTDEIPPVSFKIKRRVGYVSLHTKMNIFDLDIVAEILKTLKNYANNRRVRAIVFKTHGDRIFSAGFNLKIFKTGFSETLVKELLEKGGGLTDFIIKLNKPTIAQIQGSAIGYGCILAMACDFRIVAEKEELFFHLPELNLGIYPATGATAATVKTIGPDNTREMLFTGNKISLAKMQSWGAITRLCPLETLDKETKAFTRQLTKSPPEMVALASQSIRFMMHSRVKHWIAIENDFARIYFQSQLKDDAPPFDESVAQLEKKYT